MHRLLNEWIIGPQPSNLYQSGEIYGGIEGRMGSAPAVSDNIDPAVLKPQLEG
jgi:hypothetical protein